MKHDCPHCHASLKWRLVRSKALPGERRFLPNQAVAVCPKCGGELAPNLHWSEAAAGVAIGLPFLIHAALGSAMSREAVVWFAIGTMVLWVTAFAYFHVRHWRHWQRYKRHQAKGL